MYRVSHESTAHRNNIPFPHATAPVGVRRKTPARAIWVPMCSCVVPVQSNMCYSTFLSSLHVVLLRLMVLEELLQTVIHPIPVWFREQVASTPYLKYYCCFVALVLSSPLFSPAPARGIRPFSASCQSGYCWRQRLATTSQRCWCNCVEKNNVISKSGIRGQHSCLLVVAAATAIRLRRPIFT